MTHPVNWRAWWALLWPYWKSDRKWTPISLFVALLALTFSLTYVRLAFSVWYGHYQEAIVKYDGGAIPALLFAFLGIVSLEVAVSISSGFLNSALSIHWRRWLTHRFIKRWMSANAFYWIEQERLIDNPDQRITEDIDQFVLLSLSLALGLYGTVSSLCVFTHVLWVKSGTLNISLLGHAVRIPHYMVWVAILYSVLTSLLVQFAGRKLRTLTFQKQQAEADFRYMMTGVRQHAEQIALLSGGETEVGRMSRGFEQVRKNFWRIVFFNLRFEPVTLAVALVSSLFASFALLPRYFAHGISFGDMTQLATTFGIVAGSMQWFIQNFNVLQQYRVVISRLAGLDQAIELGTLPKGPVYRHLPGSAIELTALSLTTPEGRPLINGLSLTIRPGEQWLIKGPSGTGKSTLMRALAGIWRYGSGEVALPLNAALFFLPQKNYLPSGTLKAALCYPSHPNTFDVQPCRAALNACGLTHLANDLDVIAGWGSALSPGEQQRLGFARVLLHRPDYVLLDESTSALDEENEVLMYRLLVECLPQAAIVSISHHAALSVFHTHTLDVADTSVVIRYAPASESAIA